MTVGGGSFITEGRVNLYSLSGDLSVPTCLQNLANLPLSSGKIGNRQYAAGATLGPGLCK